MKYGMVKKGNPNKICTYKQLGKKYFCNKSCNLNYVEIRKYNQIVKKKRKNHSLIKSQKGMLNLYNNNY